MKMRKITLLDANATASKIMRDAEKNRSKIADTEASKGIQYSDTKTTKKRDAIVAISDDGEVILISLLTNSIGIQSVVDCDGGICDVYSNLPVGMYFAYCDVTTWGSKGERDIEWIVSDPIYVMPPDYLAALKRQNRKERP